MLYRLRGATAPASFLDTGLVVETWWSGAEVREAVPAWCEQLAPHLTVYPLADTWRMQYVEVEHGKAFFVASPHFDRFF